MERFINPPIQGPGTGVGPSSTTPPMIFFDDFIGVGAMVQASNDINTWDIHKESGNFTHKAVHGGAALMTTSGTDDHYFTLQLSQEFFLPGATKSFYFETRLNTDKIACDLFVGFGTLDMTMTDSAAMTGLDHAGFMTNAAANVDGTMGDGASATTTSGDTGYDLVASTDVTLAMSYDAGQDTVKWYVDGDLKLSTEQASAFLPDTELTWGIYQRNTAASSGATVAIAVDYVYIQCDR